MRIQNLITEHKDNKADFMAAMEDFLPLVMKELGLKSLPKIKLVLRVPDPEQPTFGKYVNNKYVLFVGIKNRHIIDVLRTMAHELTHYKQDIEKRLHHGAGETGSDIENEANKTAGIIMRKFNKAHRHYFEKPALDLMESKRKKKKKKTKDRSPTFRGFYGYYGDFSDNSAGDAGGDIGENMSNKKQKTLRQLLASPSLPVKISKMAMINEIDVDEAREMIDLIKMLTRKEYSNDDIGYGMTLDQIKDDISIAEIFLDHNDEMINKFIEVLDFVIELQKKRPLGEAWSKKYKKSINCNNPKGFSQRAHCQGRKKLEDYHPNSTPPGPETKPTMPPGTVRVDVSDVYDWYKLGMHISNLKGLGKHDFGKGPPSTIFSFGSEEEEHKFIKNLVRTGLTTTDIDPVDPNQPKGMKRQKTDPTYNVDENFADGKKPGRKGLSKRVGIPKKATPAQLEKISKSSKGERRRMAQWQLNMRRGRKKKK